MEIPHPKTHALLPSEKGSGVSCWKLNPQLLALLLVARRKQLIPLIPERDLFRLEDICLSSRSRSLSSIKHNLKLSRTKSIKCSLEKQDYSYRTWDPPYLLKKLLVKKTLKVGCKLLHISLVIKVFQALLMLANTLSTLTEPDLLRITQPKHPEHPKHKGLCPPVIT